MPATTFIGHFLGPDTHSNRPSATGLANGTLYVCTTHSKIERVVSGAWVDYAALGSGVTVATDTIFNAKGDLVAASAADTAASLTVGSDGQVLTADSAQTLGVKWAAGGGGGGAWTLLSTTTLSGAGTFDVSSISGAYNDLIIVAVARDAFAGGGNTSPVLRLNNDSGVNYYNERLSTAGSTATPGETIAGTSFGDTRIPQSGALANSFGVNEFTIYGYASTTWLKAVNWESYSVGYVTTGNQHMQRGGGLWNSTAAVTRVTFTGNAGGNLVTGSQLRIYGRL